MSEEIVFYHNPNSRSRIAHFMLEEIGAPYRIEPIDLEKKEQKSAKFKAINPMGKLPTIIHRDTVVTESAAICTYLADAFPEKQLAPAFDDPARGSYLRWMFFGAGCLEPALVDHLLKRPVPDIPGALGYGSYQDTLDTLERALDRGPYILGKRFTAADVFLGSEIEWGIAGRSLEPRPRFQLYLERIRARPAHARVGEQTAALNAKAESRKETKEEKKTKSRAATTRA
jgi:glutathione S-transferase